MATARSAAASPGRRRSRWRASRDKSPFAGLKVPDDVTVTRQVLAEPDGTLADRTWAALADGTPLVTAAPARQGLADPLPRHRRHELVEPAAVRHLRRNAPADHRLLVRGRRRRKSADASQPVAPYRLLDGYGHFVAAERRSAAAQPATSPPIDAGHRASARPLRHRGRLPRAQPAGRQGRRFRRSTSPTLAASACGPIRPPSRPSWRRGCSPLAAAAAGARCAGRAVAERRASASAAARRRPPSLLVAALAGSHAGLRRRRPAPTTASDKFALEAVSKTHLAYVITGDPQVDDVSKAGLRRPVGGARRTHGARARRSDRRRPRTRRAVLLPADLLADRCRARRCRRRRRWRDRRLYAPGRIGAVRHARPARTLDHRSTASPARRPASG